MVDHGQGAVVAAADQLQGAGREAGHQQTLAAQADIDRVFGIRAMGAAQVGHLAAVGIDRAQGKDIGHIKGFAIFA